MVGEGMGHALDDEHRDKQYAELISGASDGYQSAVVGLGDAIVDEVIDLESVDPGYRAALEQEDWFPGPGESVSVDDVPDYVASLGSVTLPGGRGPNQTAAAALSGADTAYLGKAEEDSLVVDALEGYGVATDHVDYDPAKGTSTSYVFTEGDGENRIAFTRGDNSILDAGYVDDTVKDVMQDAEYVLLNNGEPDEVLHHVCDVLDGMDDRPSVVFDPAPADGADAFLDYDAVDVVTPNEVEYAELSDDLAEYDGTVIRTDADGVTIDGDYRVEAPDVDPVDTTGAGDTFNGYLAGCRAQGMPMVTAAAYATHAASLSVTEEGAQGGIPSFEQVERFMDDRYGER